MAEYVEVVIKIPKEEYEEIINSEDCGLHRLTRAIANGTLLPKGHGRLIDADMVLAETDELKKSPWYNENINGSYVVRKDAVSVVEDLCVKKAPTIIEADKESEGAALDG